MCVRPSRPHRHRLPGFPIKFGPSQWPPTEKLGVSLPQHKSHYGDLARNGARTLALCLGRAVCKESLAIFTNGRTPDTEKLTAVLT